MARPPIWTSDEMEAFADIAAAEAEPDREERDLRLPLVRAQFCRDREARYRLGLPWSPTTLAPPSRPRRRR